METYSPLVLNNPELQLKLALLLTKASHTACWCLPLEEGKLFKLEEGKPWIIGDFFVPFRV